MNELWWRCSLEFFKRVTRSTLVLRSATRGSGNSQSVHTRVRTEVRYEVHVRTEVHSQEQKIDDMQRPLLSLEQITKQLNTRQSDVDHNVDHLDKNWNDVSENFPVDCLDHQSVAGVSQCTSIDHVDKDFNDESESVVIDGLISLRSQDVHYISKKYCDVDDLDSKVNNKEEYCHSESFLSTQKITELMNDIFDTPSGSACVQDVGVLDSIDVDQPSLVNNVLGDVHMDSVVKDVDKINVQTVVVLFQREKKLSKAFLSPYVPPPLTTEVKLSVPEEIMSLFRDKKKMVMQWTFPWLEDGHLTGIDFWEKLVGRSHSKRGWLSDDFPDYCANGVKYSVSWLSNGVERVYFPVNEKDPHWCLTELHIRLGVLEMRQAFEFHIPLYMDDADVFEKKNIDKDNYSISFRYADGVLIQGGLYDDCGIRVCIFLYRLSHYLPLEMDDSINVDLAYRECMIEFF
ncbi:ulp1 protease family, C-terminal catalytic domain-containing protein [Tanacetum coccineum]